MVGAQWNRGCCVRARQILQGPVPASQEEQAICCFDTRAPPAALQETEMEFIPTLYTI